MKEHLEQYAKLTTEFYGVVGGLVRFGFSEQQLKLMLQSAIDVEQFNADLSKQIEALRK